MHFTYGPALLETHKLRVKNMFGCSTVDTDEQRLETDVKGAVLLLWRLQKDGSWYKADLLPFHRLRFPQSQKTDPCLYAKLLG